jgi:hypothetical protein
MEVSKLVDQSVMGKARKLIDKLMRFKHVFTLSSLGYCIIHFLVAHNFSTYVFSGALVFGVAAAMAVAWLSNLVQKGVTRWSA